VGPPTATRHSLLDTLLRDLGPALDEINATPLTSAEKKVLVRRLIESRLAEITTAHGHADASEPQQS
jgi:hypothetical protein